MAVGVSQVLPPDPESNFVPLLTFGGTLGLVDCVSVSGFTGGLVLVSCAFARAAASARILF